MSVKLTARPSVKTTVLDFDQGKIMIYEILSAVDAQNRLQGAISR
ncbi:hypothetical protein [Rothia kristinae]|nr:hypothetical protein [Rothia kristinae]MED6046970.1 hypothetical protein [Rothia kristinae]